MRSGPRCTEYQPNIDGLMRVMANYLHGMFKNCQLCLAAIRLRVWQVRCSLCDLTRCKCPKRGTRIYKVAMLRLRPIHSEQRDKTDAP